MNFKFLTVLLLITACSKKSVDEKLEPLPVGSYAVIEGENGLKYHTGLLKIDRDEDEKEKVYMKLPACENLPESFDLRDLKLVPPIRNQGQCGSCWAFAMTGSLESALLGIGISLDLSEQELVSNDKSQYGCGGGNLNSFDYQINHGQGLEKDFPYTSGDTGRNGKSKKIPMAAQGVSFAYVGGANRSPTEQELKCALFTYKIMPSITVGATNAWGSPPKDENVMYKHCSRAITNHMVGVTGWHKDVKSKKTAFHLKNSWGEKWGAKGYMSIPLGCDNFGEEVAFIQVEKK